MLQNVRDNMKGTFVATVVFLLFIVPLVLTSVGDGSFLGSAAGTDAATVDGKAISNQELRRAIYMRKQRLIEQSGAEPSAEFLKDENLRGPVLESLTRRAALLVAAQDAGMGVSEAELDRQIMLRPEFQVDGKFDSQTYRRLLANIGFTPASYRVAISEDTLLQHYTLGLSLSAFSTDKELENLVSLIQQKRSFYTVTIPKKLVEDSVSVSDEEIAASYEENKSSYVEGEKMTAQYVELSVQEIAKTIDVPEEQIRAQYDQELSEFKKTEEYDVAHILIEEKADQAKVVEEISSKIKAGEDFAALAKEYSDDSGSKENGGSLGILTPGVFPEAFENAVFALESGQTSEPVTTDAGIHFVKVISKTVSEPPAYEARKDSIANVLKTAEAEQIFSDNFERLGELTFSAENLDEVSKALSLPLKTTASFTRSRGDGVAAQTSFRDAAFSEEVLKNGYNSSVIELSNSQAVVLRKATHEPERNKTLDEVKDLVSESLKAKKISEALEQLSTEVKDAIVAGTSAEEAAKEKTYEYKFYDKADRSSTDAQYQVVSKAFSMAVKADETNVDVVSDRDGNQILVGVTEIVPGQRMDMKDQQFAGLSNQLNIQNATFENSAYESLILESSDINIH